MAALAEPVRSAWAIALALSALVVAESSASSTLRVWGEPGEYVTGGATLTFSDASSTFRYSTFAGGLSMTVSPAGWSTSFRGPASHPLAPGTYGPLRYPASDNEPTMNDSYGVSGCVPNSGAFQVRKLRIAPDGSVRTAWITWAVQCPDGGPHQYGDFRVNADTTLWQALPADIWCFGGDSASFDITATDAASLPVALQASGLPADAAFDDLGSGAARFRWRSPAVASETIVPITVVAADDSGATDTSTTRIHVMPYALLGVTSEVGEPLGKGHPDTLSSPATWVWLSEHQANLGLQLKWKGNNRDYRFSLVAPYARALSEGVYEAAMRAPFQPSMLPGLDLSVGATGCNQVTGRFAVRRLTRDAQGKVTGIWATVEHHCEGAAPKLTAELRYNIDTTLYVQVPADVNVETGDSVRLDAHAISTRGRPVSLEVSGLPAGAAYAGAGTPSGWLRWRAPATTGEWPLTFAAADDEGRRDTVVARIQVSVPARFVMRSLAADCHTATPTLVLTGLESDFVPMPRWPYEAEVEARTGATEGLLELRAPFGFDLRKGSYTVGTYDYSGADRIYGVLTYLPGSSLRSGIAQVRKLRIDSQSYARSLWAIWRGDCGSPTTLGEIIYQADTSLYIDAPAFPMVERDRPIQFAVSGVSATGTPVQLTCTQQPPGSSFVPGPAGTATFSWPAASPQGAIPVTFVAADGMGNADTLTSLVRVMEPHLLRVDTDDGAHSRLDATNSNFYPYTVGTIDLYGYAIAQVWEIQIQTPFARRLTPGVYTNASWVSPTYAPRVPGMHITRDNQSFADCDSFHVRKVGFGADGRLSRLWMTFARTGPHLSGELRLGDPDTALYLEAPADLYVNASGCADFTAKATHALGRPVALSVRGAPAGSSFVDHGDGTGSFSWAPAHGPGTITPVTIVAADDQGREDTCVVHVHVVVPASVSVSYDPPFTSDSFSTDATRTDMTLMPRGAHGACIVAPTPTDYSAFEFVAPGDQLFTLGEYAGAQAVDPGGPGPFMRITRRAQPETEGYGSFTVLAATYDSTGRITTFRATFRDTCGWFTSAGEVCYGIQSTTPVLASRVFASGEDGVARLRWLVSREAGPALRLDRRDPGAATWRTLASLTRDARDLVTFDDSAVRPGDTYRYRLTTGDGAVLDEVVVTIAGLEPFGIRSVEPNPASRRLLVRLAGRGAGTIRLSLLDVAGRIVWRDVRAPIDSYRPDLTLHLPGELAPGVYTLRVSADNGDSKRRIVLLR